MPADIPWLSLCPKPRPKRPPLEWDVFLSYRSVNRSWVLALYDALVEADFDVFLDQFELVPGASLDDSLAANLEASASGILVWSEAAGDSAWVTRERNAMRVLADRRRDAELPFHHVVAKLDGAPLPLLLADSLWVDFAPYPEGPRGGELLRLMHAIVGESLSADAVRAIARLDAETTDAVRGLRAAVDNGFAGDIVEAARAGGEAWNSSAMLASQAAECLNQLGEYDLVLEVVELYEQRFARSIRLQHMEALAYRRTNRYREALTVLGKLYQEGHRDPETLGLYGAALAKRYEQSKDRAHLVRSQRMYSDAFAADPNDFFTGINAASKAALLGLGPDVFQPIAAQVAALPAIRNPDPDDYWALATVGEAKLLAHDLDGALAGYAEAVARHPEQKGSIQSTREQLEKLLAVLELPESDQVRLLASLAR